MQTTTLTTNLIHTLKRFTLGISLSVALGSTAAFAVSPVTSYEYDANGNLTKITEGLGHATIQQYDALNRLVTQQQPNPAAAGQLGQINMQYNAIDQLTGVTDPRNLTTAYTYNGLGDMLNLSSPDTGATTNTYDAAGNLLTKTDAKGQLTTYSYDALNRLTQITYADSQTVSYSYDQGTNGTGRLTGITDSAGTTAYTYDSHGRVTTEARTINAVTYTTTYAYNTAGQLTGVAYPTGLVLSYTRDSLGRVSQISSTKDSQTQILADIITYQPFGGIKSFTFGNGSTYSRSYDTDNRLASYTLGSKTINLDYDLASRIVAATNAANASDSKTYAYDNLDRLTSFIAPNSNQSYGYDLTGNRTSLTVGVNSYSNTIAATSNRLTVMSGPTVKGNTFDANGSITADTVNQYTYDARGRLTQAVTPSGTASYGLNALGQRVLKTLNSNSTVYHYDLNGQQIAETDNQGAIQQETVYLGNMPLAVIQIPAGAGTAQAYYVHTDHLNTSRLIEDQNQNAVWTWADDDPFANNAPDADPNNTGTSFVYNHRLPGQYYDNETQTHYNYFRDYDPATGRYIESDPIGLEGGINTYAYVEGNPMWYVDKEGKFPELGGVPPVDYQLPPFDEYGVPLPPRPYGYEHCCDPAKMSSCARGFPGLKSCKGCNPRNPATYINCGKCGMAVSGVLRNCGCDLYVPKGTCDSGCSK